MAFKHESFMALIAVLGTTISPYLFFWQALLNRRMRSFNAFHLVGKAFSNVVAFFIILTAASTLYAYGTRDVSTGEQANG